jgi:hypothetical protein
VQRKKKEKGKTNLEGGEIVKFEAQLLEFWLRHQVREVWSKKGAEKRKLAH